MSYGSYKYEFCSLFYFLSDPSRPTLSFKFGWDKFLCLLFMDDRSFSYLCLLFALAQEGRNIALGDVHFTFVSKFLWYFFILKINNNRMRKF